MNNGVILNLPWWRQLSWDTKHNPIANHQVSWDLVALYTCTNRHLSLCKVKIPLYYCCCCFTGEWSRLFLYAPCPSFKALTRLLIIHREIMQLQTSPYCQFSPRGPQYIISRPYTQKVPKQAYPLVTIYQSTRRMTGQSG